MISISYLLHTYKFDLQLHENTTICILIVGLVFVGIGTVPNQSFVTLTLTRAFPNVEFNVLLVLPQIIAAMVGPLVNYIIIYNLKWGLLSISTTYLIFSTLFAIYSQNDPKKKSFEI